MNPLLLAGAGAAAAWAMRQRFDNRVERNVRALTSVKPAAVDPRSLPERIGVLATRALDAWVPRAPVVRTTQQGRLRRRPGDAWSPYDATLWAAAGHTGYAWLARVSRLGWLDALLSESLVRGRARTESRLLGTVPLETESGVNLVRALKFAYLAELPWALPAVLGNPELRWTTSEEDGALRVSVADADEPVVVDVELDERGDIVRVRGNRPRLGATGWSDARWSREYGDHGVVGGLRVPRHAESRWESDPPFVYRRTQITALAPTSGA